ncbi:hypothetical protein EDB83DRAFT_2549274 [Lactarius deliciosus]|nr:hypothetical protein EDB83DRAFT_2549274 [Lactarius deliciosus]
MGALVPEDNNLGALFIGVILSAIVYGITWQQGYAYYTIHGNKDPFFLKILVSLLRVVDSVNLAFAAHGSYVTSITNFGDYAADTHMPWSIPSIGITGMFLEVLIQHFYAYRVYRLSKGSLYMPVVIIVLSLTAFSSGQFFCISLAITPNETEAHSKLRFFIASVAMQVACDPDHHNKYGVLSPQYAHEHSKTPSSTRLPCTPLAVGPLQLFLPSRALSWSVVPLGMLNRAALLDPCPLLTLSQVSIYQHNWIYLPFYILQVRLYSCSFMSVLNSRSHIRRKFMGSNGGAITLSQLQSDTHSGALARLPLQHGTLPTVGRTTPPPTPGARRHLSLSLLESNIPVELEKRSSCS